MYVHVLSFHNVVVILRYKVILLMKDDFNNRFLFDPLSILCAVSKWNSCLIF